MGIGLPGVVSVRGATVRGMKRLAGVLAVFLLSACGGEPADPGVSGAVESSAEPTAGVVGDPVTYNDITMDGDVTGTGVLKATSVQWVEGPQYVEEYNHTYTPDHQWLVVWVEWSGDFGFNFLGLQWVPDSTGDGVMPPLGMGAFLPTLGMQNTDAGNVVWDVPREAGSVVAIDAFGHNFGGWRVDE